MSIVVYKKLTVNNVVLSACSQTRSSLVIHCWKTYIQIWGFTS